MPLVWIIDDSATHRRIAEATVDCCPDWQIDSFASGATALSAMQRGDAFPDLVLMDYYVGGERGDQITALWRQREGQGRRATIVGYSSVASCSERIRMSGGDLVLRKTANDSINPHLLDLLTTFAS